MGDLLFFDFVLAEAEMQAFEFVEAMRLAEAFEAEVAAFQEKTKDMSKEEVEAMILDEVKEANAAFEEQIKNMSEEDKEGWKALIGEEAFEALFYEAEEQAAEQA